MFKAIWLDYNTKIKQLLILQGVGEAFMYAKIV